MSNNKICPLIVIATIQDLSCKYPDLDFNCLREKCQLWVETTKYPSGEKVEHCGLVREK